MSVDVYNHNPWSCYFFPKKDMILPCPGFTPAFLPLAIEDEAVDAGVFSLCGTGSSSEKDSHAGSSFVTAKQKCQTWDYKILADSALLYEPK